MLRAGRCRRDEVMSRVTKLPPTPPARPRVRQHVTDIPSKKHGGFVTSTNENNWKRENLLSWVILHNVAALLEISDLGNYIAESYSVHCLATYHTALSTSMSAPGRYVFPSFPGKVVQNPLHSF